MGVSERKQHESEEEKEENSEEAAYIIERIVEMKVQNGQKLFLIKWEGYEERAWVPDTNLDKEMHANRNKKRFVLHLTIKFIFNTTLAYGRLIGIRAHFRGRNRSFLQFRVMIHESRVFESKPN